MARMAVRNPRTFHARCPCPRTLETESSNASESLGGTCNFSAALRKTGPRKGPSKPLSPQSRFTSQFEVSGRSEEHTSELQSLAYLVCRLLLEKKKKHN